MDNSTPPKCPTPDAYDAACRALWAHRDRASTLSLAIAGIRGWRILQPRTAAVDFALLDEILDAVAVNADVPLQRITPPRSLPEAVAAHRAVLEGRRQALAAVERLWGQMEAAAIRGIDRHMPRGGTPT